MINLSTSLIHNRYDSIKLLELTTFVLRQNYSSFNYYLKHIVIPDILIKSIMINLTFA